MTCECRPGETYQARRTYAGVCATTFLGSCNIEESLVRQLAALSRKSGEGGLGSSMRFGSTYVPRTCYRSEVHASLFLTMVPDRGNLPGGLLDAVAAAGAVQGQREVWETLFIISKSLTNGSVLHLHRSRPASS